MSYIKLCGQSSVSKFSIVFAIDSAENEFSTQIGYETQATSTVLDAELAQLTTISACFLSIPHLDHGTTDE